MLKNAKKVMGQAAAQQIDLLGEGISQRPPNEQPQLIQEDSMDLPMITTMNANVKPFVSEQTMKDVSPPRELRQKGHPSSGVM